MSDIICVWCKKPCGAIIWYEPGSALPHCSKKCMDAIKCPEDLLKPSDEPIRGFLHKLAIDNERRAQEIRRFMKALDD